ncbi:MAG TPA: hypothetical protein VGK39_04640, partial [Cyclobacteriaceae bacterium]
KPGVSSVVKFVITPGMMELVNAKGERVIESGKFKISIGGSLPGKRSETLGSSKSQEIFFTVQ